MSQVELVRERWFFDHSAPDVRTITLEVTVRNTGGEELFQVFLPLHAFLANLQVLDESGRNLNFLPNRDVERALEDAKREDPAAYDRAMTSVARPAYRISIVLPQDAPLRPGELRTIRLVYTDGTRPHYLPLRALTLPSYHVTHLRRAGQPYGIHVAVTAPADTQLDVDLDDETVRGQPHYHVTPPEEIDYHFNAYLPPPEQETYLWRVNYHVGPTLMEEFILTAWLALAAVLGVWTLLSAFLAGVPALDSREMFAVAGGLSATSAGLLLGLKNAWASRYLKLLLPVFAVSAIAWLRWFVVGG